MPANEKSEPVKPMSLDALFEKQSRVNAAATVEPVPGKPDLVKITPWIANSGCQCHLAIEVPKASIEHVIATGDTHPCCGKVLSVVEVKFLDKSQMSLAEVFAQMSARASGTHTDNLHGHSHPTPETAASHTTVQSIPNPNCIPWLEDCLANAADFGTDPCRCNQRYFQCIGKPWLSPKCIPKRIDNYSPYPQYAAAAIRPPIHRGGQDCEALCANSYDPDFCYCTCRNRNHPSTATPCYSSF